MDFFGNNDKNFGLSFTGILNYINRYFKMGILSNKSRLHMEKIKSLQTKTIAIYKR